MPRPVVCGAIPTGANARDAVGLCRGFESVTTDLAGGEKLLPGQAGMTPTKPTVREIPIAAAVITFGLLSSACSFTVAAARARAQPATRVLR